MLRLGYIEDINEKSPVVLDSLRLLPEPLSGVKCPMKYKMFHPCR